MDMIEKQPYCTPYLQVQWFDAEPILSYSNGGDNIVDSDYDDPFGDGDGW